MRQSKILLISANSHQKKTFNFISSHLPAGFSGKVIRVKSVLSFSIAGLFCAFPKSFGKIPQERVEEIMEFTVKRRLARQALFAIFPPIIRWALRFRSRFLYQLFCSLLQSEAPDLVVVWGGLALPISAAAAAAKDLGYKLLFCENGYLPKTIVMDPVGVNAKNSLVGKERSFYDQILTEPEKLSALFSQDLIQRPLKRADASLEHRLQETEKENQLPEAYIFLPLQVHDDSQVLLYSPRFKQMPVLIRYCHEQISHYNQRRQTKLRLVVKEHPSDFGRIDYSAIKEELQDEVLFVQAIGTPELLQGCKAVITLNSTVGIEGLFKFKPVITLGEAFYNVKGLLYHLEAGEELSELLDQALNNPIDIELTKKFLYYLRYSYLVPFDRREIENTDPAGFIKRITETLHHQEAIS